MIRRMCAYPACFSMAEIGKRYCLKHAGNQAADDARKAVHDKGRWERGPSAAHRWVYQDARWRKLRKAHLDANPACARCGSPATDVHHIVPHLGREVFAFNADNLESLCHACHMKITRGRQDNA